MSKCLVVEHADGSLSIVHPAPDARRPDEPEDEFYARAFAATVAKNLHLQAKPTMVHEVADLPTSGSRYAWRLLDGRVYVDPSVPVPVRKLTLEERVTQLENR